MTKTNRTITIIVALFVTGLMALPAGAHVHVAENSPHKQELANGQNHPGFVEDEDPESDLILSCEGVNEPVEPQPLSGPAGYGLETAHHGPDAGTPGKADGCYATDGPAPPADNNPGID